jgi:hypothetical protein
MPSYQESWHLVMIILGVLGACIIGTRWLLRKFGTKEMQKSAQEADNRARQTVETAVREGWPGMLQRYRKFGYASDADVARATAARRKHPALPAILFWAAFLAFAFGIVPLVTWISHTSDHP